MIRILNFGVDPNTVSFRRLLPIENILAAELHVVFLSLIVILYHNDLFITLL